MVLIVWCRRSTTAFTWRFLTMVEIELILLLCNIATNWVFRNPLPLSWIHFFGNGYLLNHESSKVWATVFAATLSTGMTSGKAITASIQVRALMIYSNLLMVIFQGPIISTQTSSQWFKWFTYLGGICPYF